MKELRIPSHLLVAASAWASKLIMAFVQFASIRVLMNGLGVEQYAIFALLTALVVWYLLADMGIGLSLQNNISKRRAQNQPYDDYITATLSIAIFLLFFTIVVLYFVSPYLAPTYLKHFVQLDDATKTQLFFITGALFISAAIGGISYKIWYAEQKGYFANILPAVASLIGYFGILAVSNSDFPNKLLLSLVVFLAPSALLPLAAITFQCVTHMKKGPSKVESIVFTTITKQALNFWFLLIISSLSLQFDYLIISQFLKAEDIVVYSLSTKISWFILFLYVSALSALWPVFSEAIAQNNWALVNRLTKKYLSFGLAFAFTCSLLLVWLMPIAVRFLAPNETIIIPVMFIILLGVYQVLRVWTDTFTMILQSMSDLKPLWIVGPFQVILTITSQWYFTQSIGLYGIILGNILSFALTSAWFLPRAVMAHYKSSMK